ncbi:MAG: 4Fe-4S single cluster domain-containing protein [Myxococcota bacterium]|nr:4Fe-4S single cluster domain-containing protein [Myxococcota bacterium]
MRPALTLGVHALLERSYANGPGCRAVIWTQGCSIRCPGCFNPDAQDLDVGESVPVAALAAWVRSITGIEGVTLSGGEPLQQRAPVGALLREIRRSTALSVVLFTGYDWTHITVTPGFLEVAQLADVVIAGPYRRHQRLERGLRGSANQTVHLPTGRYSLAEVDDVPEAEVIVGDGAIVETGVAVPTP